jgi:hypothetical protein
MYGNPINVNNGNKISKTHLNICKITTMKQFEVKVQLQGGTTTTTVVYAENDYKARQLIRMQFGDSLESIHYVREA